MTSSKNKFYLTTPIYYVTAKPHIGHLYTTVIADVVARWQKLLGKEVFFLTGTDEHGNKVAQAAQASGVDPKTFVDGVSDNYKKAWKLFDIDYTAFIRTTDADHKKAVYAWIEKAEQHGDIYKSHYEGWYCQPDEAFVAEKTAVTGDEPPLCPLCNRPTILVSEESYFFRLSAYQDRLLTFYKENPDFITPKERLHEVISFVESGLKDLSISRTTVQWGIPFPNDPKHVIYVWVDALTNYISAIGYGQPGREQEFATWWPADVHTMGKEIVRFHAVYWPAFLMAVGLQLPKKLLVHGWITIDGQKMSKSLGNVIDPQQLHDAYGVEPVKYYLLRHLPINQDGDFSHVGIEHAINADLADGLGNLLNRLTALAEKNGLSTVPAPKTWSSEAIELQKHAQEMIAEYQQYMNEYSFHLALARLWKFVNQVNAYFHSQEPWKLAKSKPAEFAQVLSATCHALRTISVLLWPVMPEKMEALQESIGLHCIHDQGKFGGIELDRWNANFVLTKIPTLFQKIEKKEQEAVSETAKSATKPESGLPEIAIDLVAQVELVVGTIKAAQAVEKSDKLLQMTVDFGDRGERTVLAGIRKWYQPDDLIGRQAVFIYNLKPRAMMGVMSQGMLLVAEDADGKVHPVSPGAPVPNGTRLR